jgi:hypothetical protein
VKGRIMTTSPLHRPKTLPERVCDWCGRRTRDWTVQVADDHAPEIVWCRNAEPCHTIHADRKAAREAREGR